MIQKAIVSDAADMPHDVNLFPCCIPKAAVLPALNGSQKLGRADTQLVASSRIQTSGPMQFASASASGGPDINGEVVV